MRSFAATVANLHWMVFRRLPNPTFFISCADDEQAKDAHLLDGYYPEEGIFIERVKQPVLNEPPFNLCRHSPYAPTPNNQSVVQSILRQMWHYRRVWDFHCEKAPTAGFDTYVRCRPDLFFHRFDMPAFVRPNEFIGPWKATCGGVNDRFSVMGQIAAMAYFNSFSEFERMMDAGCPLHPESIQEAAMGAIGTRISNTLLAEFTVMRLSGRDNVPLVEYPGEMARFIEQTLVRRAENPGLW